MTLLVEVLLTRSDEICPEYYNGYELVSCLGDEFVIDLAHRAAGEMAIRFVKDKLQVETVEHTFKTPSDEARETLWMLIQRKEKRRGHSTVYSKGGLEGGLGAAFMLALMDKGLPRWCWGGHARHSMDNLLQYTLTFLKKLLLNPYMDHGKTEAERQLCLELAKRFSLEELCYQNKHGQNALYYAVKFVDASDQAFPLLKFLCDGDEAHAWMEVRDTIRQQMELRVREFQGSLMELVALTASVLDALEGECLPAFDDQLEQRATPIREQWYCGLAWQLQCYLGSLCFFGSSRSSIWFQGGTSWHAPPVMPVNSLNLETCTANVQGSTFEVPKRYQIDEPMSHGAYGIVVSAEDHETRGDDLPPRMQPRQLPNLQETGGGVELHAPQHDAMKIDWDDWKSWEWMQPGWKGVKMHSQCVINADGSAEIRSVWK
eukprot:Skav219001  [mRNA]  locus=scaffold169:388324:401091:+ [translate_table: standard]